MIIRKIEEVEVDATHLKCQIGVRYWEDGKVDGKEDSYGELIPLRNGDMWNITINLETGEVQNWPKGTKVETYYKVCDDGVYTLLDQDGKELLAHEGYVPKALQINDEGYGDYIIITINEDGLIENWDAESLNDEFDQY